MPKANAQTRLREMTDAELDFLWYVSKDRPSRWKGELLSAWAYRSDNPPQSQSIRNRIGPSGLRSLTGNLINDEWQLRRRLKARGPL